MATNNITKWLFGSVDKAPAATILLRLMAGSVFLWEGILKFVYPNLGIGRFTKLGIPAPGIMGPFVAILEIVGGILLISGFLTRLIAIPFIIEMIVAMLSTKIPMLRGTYPLALAPSPPTAGIWLVLHEIRSEYAQFMISLFFLLAGPGRLSIDALIGKKIKKRNIIGEFSDEPLKQKERSLQEQPRLP
jgi:putative oxidoreductase